ncbi:uncharacterized protein N7483_002886 [Penicillium malachiteum]|uniref:uncharacterized protein n=1 Tax=Penicillium malachiteum TaxID=1324776 RepID=UPI002547C232|nr:uncharacterized protein N7483_002886 [Penicillium malachiteum]KAJ5737761.1 hypothetical protein N7483_002886 [Penicillium malachiteum]
MESSGTGDLLVHGPPPDASQNSNNVDSPSHLLDSDPVSDQSFGLSRSSSLLQNKQSIPRAHSGARHAKRLTLNFPINLPLNQTPTATPDSTIASPGSMTPVTQSSTRPSPALPAGSIPFDAQDDGYDFLRAIASQERKVMELREELQRAESDLSTLKKQWALSEKSKKRTEINLHAEPLIPLRSPDLKGTEAGSSSSSHRREQSMSSVGSSVVPQGRVSRELEWERRSSIRAAATAGTSISSNGRRVFQGSHTRTLSLLSPVTVTGPSSTSPSFADNERVGRTPRSATLPSVERNNNNNHNAATNMMINPIDESQVPEHLLSQWRKTMPPPSREALMRTGKQMASDLREGLWTFLEDIRQATVGEEGINGTESRTMSPPNSSLSSSNPRKRSSIAKSQSRERLSVVGGVSRSSSSSSRGKGQAAEPTTGKDSKPADIATSFWHEFGVDSPAQKSPGARRNPSEKTADATTPRGENEPDHLDHHSGSLVNNMEDDDTADNWDVWDTPLSGSKTRHTPSSSRSTVESKRDQSPTTRGSSPRTSASFGEWNPLTAAPESNTETIPWPTITKLAPSKLQRTASNLMAEWERSLSPSPERKDSSSGKSSKND